MHNYQQHAFTASPISYTGWPNKNGMPYFPWYVDAITGISVWGNFWEKLYQDNKFWFSYLFSRAHFVRQRRSPKCSLFSLNYPWTNVISACHSCEHNPFNFVNAHFTRVCCWCKKMHIDTVNGITAHIYGRTKWHSLTLSLRWKGKIWSINIVSQNVP